MAEIRYYSEFDDEEKTCAVHAGEPTLPTVDVDLWDSRTSRSVIARVGTRFYAEIGLGWIGISHVVDEEYLDRFCQEITEEEAKKQHPELFMYLYQNNILKGK